MAMGQNSVLPMVIPATFEVLFLGSYVTVYLVRRLNPDVGFSSGSPGPKASRSGNSANLYPDGAAQGVDTVEGIIGDPVLSENHVESY